MALRNKTVKFDTNKELDFDDMVISYMLHGDLDFLDKTNEYFPPLKKALDRAKLDATFQEQAVCTAIGISHCDSLHGPDGDSLFEATVPQIQNFSHLEIKSENSASKAKLNARGYWDKGLKAKRIPEKTRNGYLIFATFIDGIWMCGLGSSYADFNGLLIKRTEREGNGSLDIRFSDWHKHAKKKNRMVFFNTHFRENPVKYRSHFVVKYYDFIVKSINGSFQNIVCINDID